MSLNCCKRWCLLMIVLSLFACSSTRLQPIGTIGEMSRNDFMNAMRWKRFKDAASFMQADHRQDFMAIFTPLKGLHITDVRLASLQESAEDRRFEASFEMDYYLLPSVTVKTLSFDQTWVFFDGDDPAKQGFIIVSPFPAFP